MGETGLAPLDVDAPDEVRTVAELHREHFPETTEARFGTAFLTDCYYRALVRDGVLGCTVARREGRVVAFISYTRTPRRLLRIGARRHPWLLATGLLRAAIADADAARALVEHARVAARARGAGASPTLSPDCGEVLLIAVGREHQAWKPPGGDARVAVRLFRAMESELRRQGCARVLLVVGRRNTASQLFCHAMGCRIDPAASNPRQHHFWYDLEAAA